MTARTCARCDATLDQEPRPGSVFSCPSCQGTLRAVRVGDGVTTVASEMSMPAPPVTPAEHEAEEARIEERLARLDAEWERMRSRLIGDAAALAEARDVYRTRRAHAVTRIETGAPDPRAAARDDAADEASG